MFSGNRWYAIKDGNHAAYDLFTRHYSFNKYKDNRRAQLDNPNRHLFVDPGEKLVLMTSDSRALFVWRKFQDASGQTGVNCAVFRNEGDYLSSELITEAEQIAWVKWPGERLYTYVAPQKVSDNPGYCFKMAGWKTVGITKVNKLHILEKLPEA